MATPKKKPDTSKIEVLKATKAGKVDKRRKTPLRVETQTKTSASRVVARGNKAAARTRGVDSTLAGDRSFASVAGKPDVEIPKSTGKIGATAQAILDAKGTDLEKRPTKTLIQKTSEELDQISAEKKAANAKRKAERSAKPIYTNDASPREHSELAGAARNFGISPPGSGKEALRQRVGRQLQTRVFNMPDNFKIPCQTPHCSNMIKWDTPKADVICPSCHMKGDVAAKRGGKESYGNNKGDNPSNKGTATIGGAEANR